jgi:hypothetical protein
VEHCHDGLKLIVVLLNAGRETARVIRDGMQSVAGQFDPGLVADATDHGRCRVCGDIVVVDERGHFGRIDGLACLLQLDFPFDIVFATGWRLTRIQIVCQSHHRKDLGIHGIFHV